MEQLPQALANGLLLASIYAIIALGLTLIFGVLDVINFSHGMLVSLGAYLVYELSTRDFPLWLSLPAVMAVLAVGGLLMEVTTFRPVRAIPINGLLVSIGWVAILSNVFDNVWGPNQYNAEPALEGALELGPVTVSRNQVLVLVVSILVMAVLAAGLRYTATGKKLRASAMNREAAMLVGISPRRMDGLAFAIGAGLAGLAGGLLANLFPVDPGLGESYMVFAFVALIVGGAGSAVGAVAGSAVVGLAVSLAQTFGSTAVASVAPFVVLIAVLFFRPSGLFAAPRAVSL
jgi:branched-chain amino acid transport system permease protein